MKIQSCSIVVPNKECINSCKFCVACMLEENYENMIDDNLYWDLYEKDFINRLEFARENGCNTVMLTGNSEPQQNKTFLKMFGRLNKDLNKPFRIIEMQTTGVLLDNDYLYFLRHYVGVTTISLSISSFDNDINREINQTPEKLKVYIEDLCKRIKKYRFNLRISINLTNCFDSYSAKEVLDFCKNELKADQITFRVLYKSGKETKQDKWIEKNKAKDKTVKRLKKYVENNGEKIQKLEFGLIKYSVNEMSIVIDDDCMSQEVKENLKYVILRPNCKLYSRWEDKGSLIF